MIPTIDIIIIHLESSDSINIHRTRRAIDALSNEAEEYEVTIIETTMNQLSDLELKSEWCLFMVAGDLIVKEYLTKFANYSQEALGLIFQPHYTYLFDDKQRHICKNIDMSKDLASYDSLAIRFYASRHFISKSSLFSSFVNNHHNLNGSFLWSYLNYLLEQDHSLICLQNAITFEYDDAEFKYRHIHNMNTMSAPIEFQGFEYEQVLCRQNINNINVYEKQIATQTPVSLQTMGEAIADMGLNKGARLTSVRLWKRVNKRLKNKNLSMKETIIETKDDLQSTLTMK